MRRIVKKRVIILRLTMQDEADPGDACIQLILQVAGRAYVGTGIEKLGDRRAAKSVRQGAMTLCTRATPKPSAPGKRKALTVSWISAASPRRRSSATR